MASKFTPINPKPFKPNRIQERLRKAVKKQATFSNKQFAKTYSTWDHKPEFEETFEETATQMVGSALTSGEGSRDNPYPFITKGTDKRYVVMTPDFVPKSTPRIIGSKRGRGGFSHFDPLFRARPGIKAREFEPEIAKREEPKFYKRIQKAMQQGAKDTGYLI